MRLAVLFENIGGYHAARLRATQAAVVRKNWELVAIQISEAQGEHPWGDTEMDFPVETVMPNTGPLSGKDRRRSGARVHAMLDRLRPSAVALPGWGFSYARAALRWCAREHVPAILMSDSKQDDEPRHWWKEWVKSRIVRKFSAALVAGQAHADYLVALCFPREKIFFGYDVVDNAYFARAADAARSDSTAARARQPLIPGRPYFLAVTRFIPRKNLALLLEAFADYRARAQGREVWDLVVCGSGTEEPRLRAFLRARELEHAVHFPGFIPYSKMGDWYGLAGAFVHPALQEQWGLVVNEAMASRLTALVSNRCGCFPELVREGSTGFGFDPESKRDLTGLLTRCANGNIDRGSVGRAAAAHLNRFTPEHFAEGLLSAVAAAGANM